MPVNTAYLNVAGTSGPPIGLPSQFTVAVSAAAVGIAAAAQTESSYSVPPRLLPQNRSTGSFLNPGTLVLVAPDSALSSGFAYCAYVVPATNTVTLRFVNGSNSTVTQRAGTWGFGLLQGLP